MLWDIGRHSYLEKLSTPPFITISHGNAESKIEITNMPERS